MSLNRRRISIGYPLTMVVLFISSVVFYFLGSKTQEVSAGELREDPAKELAAPPAVTVTDDAEPSRSGMKPPSAGDALLRLLPEAPTSVARPDLAAACRMAGISTAQFASLLGDGLRSKDALAASRANLLAGNLTVASALAAKAAKETGLPLADVVSALHLEGLSLALSGRNKEALLALQTAASLSAPRANQSGWLRLQGDLVALEVSQGLAEDACNRLQASVAAYATDGASDDQAFAALLTCYGEALLASGKASEAQPHLAAASIILRRGGGPGSAAWVDCGALQIQAFHLEGSYARGEAIFTEMKSVIAKLPVQEQRNAAVRRLAMRLMAQGQFAAAQPLLADVLASHRKLSAAPSTIRGAVANLLSCHLFLGELEQAKTLSEELISMPLELSLFDMRICIADLTSVAPLLLRSGMGDKAVRCLESVVAIRKARFPDETAEFVLSLNEYAAALQATSDAKGAMAILSQSLDLQDKSEAPDPEVQAATCVRLGSLHLNAQDNEKAFSYYERAVAVAGTGPVARSQAMVDAYDAFAARSEQNSDLVKSEDYRRRSLDILQRGLGENAPSLAVRYNNLAALLEKNAKTSEAEILYRKALFIADQNKGMLAAEREIFCGNLINLYKSTLKMGEVENYTLRLIALKAESLGVNDPEIAKIHNNLAMWLEEQGKNDRAMIFYREAVLASYRFRKETKKKSPNEATCVANYSGLLRAKGVGTADLEKELNGLLREAGLLAP